MIYTQKIKDAIKFSIKTHEIYQKQKRKGKDIPYITHPLTVGLILTRAGADEDTIVAGILHDTIEDSTIEKKVTPEMLSERFSQNVADLVLSVTEQNKELPWGERKQKALEHIKDFSHDSLLVKSADVLSNLSELVDDYKKDGDKIFARFNASKEELINGSLAVVDTLIEQWKESPLAADLKRVKEDLKDSGMMSGLYWAVTNEKSGYDVPVYLVNTTDKAITARFVFAVSHSDIDDGVFDLGSSKHRDVVVLPNGFVQIDHLSDPGQLDFTTSYNLSVGEKEYSFHFNGWTLFHEDGFVTIPVISKKGHLKWIG